MGAPPPAQSCRDLAPVDMEGAAASADQNSGANAAAPPALLLPADPRLAHRQAAPVPARAQPADAQARAAAAQPQHSASSAQADASIEQQNSVNAPTGGQAKAQVERQNSHGAGPKQLGAKAGQPAAEQPGESLLRAAPPHLHQAHSGTASTQLNWHNSNAAAEPRQPEHRAGRVGQAQHRIARAQLHHASSGVGNPHIKGQKSNAAAASRQPGEAQPSNRARSRVCLQEL